MKKIILAVAGILLASQIAAADTFYFWRYRTHATDCTSLTDGKDKDLCYEQSSQKLYKCVPTAGDCDTAGEWKLTSSAVTPGGSNGQVQYNNSGAFGGIGNSSVSGENLTINGNITSNSAFLTGNLYVAGSSVQSVVSPLSIDAADTALYLKFGGSPKFVVDSNSNNSLQDLEIGDGTANTGIIIKDDQTANYGTIKTTKLTSGRPELQIADLGNGVFSILTGSGTLNHMSYFTAAGVVAGSKYFMVDATNAYFDIGNDGKSGTLRLYYDSISDFRGSLITAALNANRTWTFPNETGTVCTTGSVCSGYQSSLTTGNLTATSPIQLSATRQVIGGAVVASIVNDGIGPTQIDETAAYNWSALHQYTGSASGAAQRINASAAPSSPAEGDHWNDSTDKSLEVFNSGIRSKVWKTIYISTADATLTGTANETSLIGTAPVSDTKTLPADFLTAGRIVRITANGFCTTPASSPATIVFKIKLGSTVILQSATLTPSTSMTNRSFDMQAIITGRTTGATGTVVGSGRMNSTPLTTWGLPRMMEILPPTPGTPVVIDTTSTQVIDFTGQLSSGAGTDSYTITNVLIEVN